ncbi:MAG TPA: hypothetical protein VI727_09800 [Candidatus Brocadiaceae bacterium]|nr:hypothetical protein [Candidatus Brocadiaceae bacterium]
MSELLEKIKTKKFELRFIALADRINSAMPEFVVEKITDALKGINKKHIVRL